MSAAMQLLLISNSTQYGSGYLDHCEAQLRDMLASARQVIFVPFALGDWQAYTKTARERFRAMGYHLTGLHEHTDQLQALQQAEAVFVGGGLDEDTATRALNALTPGGRLVANAVTLQSEGLLATLHARHGGELCRIAVARAEPVGNRTGWRPMMPVTQWVFQK